MSDHHLKITMTWTSAIDFDLAALYETEKGGKGIIYFGDLGNADKPPYIHLSGDKGVNDAAGQHEETMTIRRPDNLKHAWFFCWDYGMIQEGKPARFQDSDIKLTLTNHDGKVASVALDHAGAANVCALAQLTITDNTTFKLGKLNKSGILKGLYQIEQLQAVLAD